MKSKVFLIILLILVVLPIVGFLIVKNYYDTSISSPNGGSSAQVLVTIEPGTSIRSIAAQLKEDGLIQDERVFEYYVRSNKLEDAILAGTYETTANRTIPEIVTDLQTPIETEVRITLPEGLRHDQVAERLDKVMKISPNWSEEEFLDMAKNPGDRFDEFSILDTKPADKSLEGFLFPDTYIFSIEASTEEVMSKLIENTQNRISGDLLQDIIDSEFTIYEVLNFASMIERETMKSEDRYLVGDVLYKRYKERWKLGIDATLLYEQGDWKHILTQKELETKTPYNTRTNLGLPPTPICNPGLESIKGFVYREENDYYYYVSDTSGNIYYARTWSEHQNNIRKHLR